MNDPVYSIEQVASWINQFRTESTTAGAATGRVIQELEALAIKDQALNQRLMAARSQGVNLRPIYLACSSLLLERARVFQELSASTAQSADLFLRSVERADKLFGLYTQKGVES